MAKPKVFVTRVILEQGLQRVQDFCEVDLWTEELPPAREEVLRRVRGVDGILSLLTDTMDATAMDAAGPGLKVISNYAVGYDNIDVPAATQRGIAVGNTPGVLTDATADLSFALLMAAARRVVEGQRYVRDGHWRTWGPSLLLGTDMVGATLGIIGYGRIGRAVAKRASGFDMNILYYDPTIAPNSGLPGRQVDLPTLLRESDFVSVHTPLTPETHHMINRQAFQQMKPSAVLVNTARGPIVDPDALFEALRDGQIFAAALDVTEPEPIAMDSPLLTLDNLTIVPHIASASIRTRQQMAVMAAENLIAGLKGEALPNSVNPQVKPKPSDAQDTA